MRESSATDLVSKLLSVGILLGMVNVSEMGSSTFAPIASPEWTLSEASTFRLPRKSRSADIEVALVEVRSARAILSAQELDRETAFGEYLTALDSALNAYDRTPDTGGREVRLATALAVARTTLLDGVTRLSSWTAIVRSTGRDDRFTAVPERFIEAPAPLAHEEDLQRSVEIWLDLHSLEV